MSGLVDLFRQEAGRLAPTQVRAFALQLAAAETAAAVLFYGSALRTGDLAGVLDFYVLTAPQAGARPTGRAWLWPDIRFAAVPSDQGELHAKVAILPLATFRRAARGGALDTTVWTRFVQPSALAFARDAAAEAQVVEALADAARTAARFAAVLGPSSGAPVEFWSALFRQTYAAELRVEPPGRERQVLGPFAARYDALLPLAWAEAGVPFDREGAALAPRLSPEMRRRTLAAWRLRRAFGKPLNAARLAKAALRTPGAARYAAGKLARHRGVALEVTPWRERHPLLAGLGVLWRLRRRQPEAR
ncbi:MAG: hypothetical protein INR64_00330 [Caulobacteraceae bacterium]|nr:hypothetical protein [Caulobacter sp.]